VQCFKTTSLVVRKSHDFPFEVGEVWAVTPEVYFNEWHQTQGRRNPSFIFWLKSHRAVAPVWLKKGADQHWATGQKAATIQYLVDHISTILWSKKWSISELLSAL
jgi:hypothetical protein